MRRSPSVLRPRSPHSSLCAYLDDGHARDDRGGVLDGGAVDGVVGADDKGYVGVLELGIDLRHEGRGEPQRKRGDKGWLTSILSQTLPCLSPTLTLPHLVHLQHDVVRHPSLGQQDVHLTGHAAGDRVDAETDLEGVQRGVHSVEVCVSVW